MIGTAHVQGIPRMIPRQEFLAKRPKLGGAVACTYVGHVVGVSFTLFFSFYSAHPGKDKRRGKGNEDWPGMTDNF